MKDLMRKQDKPPNIEAKFRRTQANVVKFIQETQAKRRKIVSDQITSYIRTIIPSLVGAFVAWLAQKGINVPVDIVVPTTALLTAVFGALYYYIVRKLEAKYPKLGILLGIAKTPTY